MRNTTFARGKNSPQGLVYLLISAVSLGFSVFAFAMALRL
jgi:hypothetical protein